MQEVVPMAVRKAVSAATKTFTASSMMRCFFIIYSLFSFCHTDLTDFLCKDLTVFLCAAAASMLHLSVRSKLLC